MGGRRRRRICLNKIVKNEIRVEGRCLENVTHHIPHIDAVAICDTGSTDGTPELIEKFICERGILGGVLRSDWKEFDGSRNEALRFGDHIISLITRDERKLQTHGREGPLLKSEWPGPKDKWIFMFMDSDNEIFPNNTGEDTVPAEEPTPTHIVIPTTLDEIVESFQDQEDELPEENIYLHPEEDFYEHLLGEDEIRNHDLTFSGGNEERSYQFSPETFPQEEYTSAFPQDNEWFSSDSLGEGEDDYLSSEYEYENEEEQYPSEDIDEILQYQELPPLPDECFPPYEECYDIDESSLQGDNECFPPDDDLLPSSISTEVKKLEISYSPLPFIDPHDLPKDVLEKIMRGEGLVTPLCRPWGLNVQNFKDDGYSVRMKCGPVEYEYLWMISHDPRGRKLWEWKYPVHEYIHAKGGWYYSKGYIDGGWVHSGRDGSRGSDPNKYMRDALVFERLLLSNPNDDRATFYGAQSYRDCRRLDRSLELYQKRTTMGGWNDEIYVSQMACAKIMGELEPNDLWYIFRKYALAMEARPDRLEAVYELVEICRRHGLFQLGWIICKPFIQHRRPTISDLLVENAIYGWKFHDSASMCAFYSGDRGWSRCLIEYALRYHDIPDDQRARMVNNLRFC